MKKINKLGKLMLLLIWSLVLKISPIIAQLPTHYPDPKSDPPELTFINILVYFVTPVLLILIWFFYRRSQRKKREKQKEESSGKE